MFAIFISRNGCLSLLLKHLTAFVFHRSPKTVVHLCVKIVVLSFW